MPTYIFERLTSSANVIATIAYVGDHWAATWWHPHSTNWYFAEGLNFDVKPTQYKFRDWVQEIFSVTLDSEPTRCYIGYQCDLNQFGDPIAKKIAA